MPPLARLEGKGAFLAVGDFAHMPTILRGNARRVSALFRKAAPIQNHYPIRFAQSGRDYRLDPFQEGPRVPGV